MKNKRYSGAKPAIPRPASDAIDVGVPALHAKWVLEALQSGPAQVLKMKDMDAAFACGVSRARQRI
ncbi:MAG: hypothetical protein P4M10_05245 [Verrucomicrobiae bacterium]|nr:hypothetical protein [Verrucomicrobiae bacterium]